MLERIENRTIQKYGFESRRTIFIFWLTHYLRKIKNIFLDK